MKRILQISSRLPYPLDDGARIATWNLSRCLKHNGYTLDLICFARDEGDVREASETLSQVFDSVSPVIKNVERQYPRALIRSFLKRSSYFVEKYYEEELAEKMRGLYRARNYDVTLIDSAYMGVYARIAREHPEASGRLVVRAHNVEFELLERLASGEKRPWYRPILKREARLFKRSELSLINEMDQVFTITDRDAEKFRSVGAEGKLVPLSPFIDMDHYCLEGSGAQQTGDVVCVGNMAWMPNRNGILWFCKNVWPQVRAAQPDAKFWIVGKNPPSEISRLDGVDGITVTGYVEDERPYIARSHLFVVPLLEGSGVRIKILTAMAMGCSVLSTTVGAEGISWDGLTLCDAPEQWAETIIERLQSPPSVDPEAVEYIARNYDWRRELSI